MFHVIRPLDKLSVNEICELAQQAAHRGEPLEQANVFQCEVARTAFEAAYRSYSEETS